MQITKQAWNTTFNAATPIIILQEKPIIPKKQSILD
jgi:hypothetical protein